MDPTYTIIGITVLVNFIPISMKTLFAFYLRFIRCKARGIVPGSHRLNARGLVMFITSKFSWHLFVLFRVFKETSKIKYIWIANHLAFVEIKVISVCVSVCSFTFSLCLFSNFSRVKYWTLLNIALRRYFMAPLQAARIISIFHSWLRVH